MGSITRDNIVATIETIYAAGLDAQHWPNALAAITRTVGGIAATLEVFDRKPLALTEFHSFGLPPANELAYLDQFSSLNPRIPALINGEPGSLVTDYSVMTNERGMNRNAFYSEFLAPVGYRYFLGGILTVDEEESSLFSVQRATTQGHVDRVDMVRMRTLLPHVRRAFDVSRRLRDAQRKSDAFEHTLDWLSDGAALVRRDGRVLYANQAFEAIVRRHDGLRIARGTVEFESPQAHVRFAAALAAVCRLDNGDPAALDQADFPAPRAAGAPAYIVSLRPLVEAKRGRGDAIAVVFVRDPLRRNGAGAKMLRELFGFTEAEANLAQALQAGVLLEDYARENAVTLNTVYTHLRRIKEKTGCTRIGRLYRKLKELEVPLGRN
jgi:DNA-binding CsgD family transcriptional regulator